MRNSGWRVLVQAAQDLTTHQNVGLPSLLQCAKIRGLRRAGNFLPVRRPITKLTTGLCGVAFYSISAALRPGVRAYIRDRGVTETYRVAQALKVI